MSVYCRLRYLLSSFALAIISNAGISQVTVPLSHIDVPVSVDLKPLYAFANRFVDTLYTSPEYPNGWIEDGCDKRYQYRFIRGPFNFTASNDVLLAKFTGYYTVRGSTRICTGLGKTPWTPPCSCGTGSEKPRRVDAGFGASMALAPDYSINIKLQSINPRPLDKCEICAFGLDITPTVVQQVKAELDASLHETVEAMKALSLKPYLQQLWDTLQAGIPVPGFGRLLMNPEALRFSRIQLRRDSMFMSIGLSVRPQLSPFVDAQKKLLPMLSDFNYREGFGIQVAQILPYDSLDGILNKNISGKEVVLGKGLLSKTIVIDSAHLSRYGNGVRISMYSSKGVQGMFALNGIPAWDSARGLLYFDSLDHEIVLEQKFLQNISNLFDKTILRKLQQLTSVDLKEQTDSLKISLNHMLNSELYKGVKSSGTVQNLSLTSLIALQQGIYLSGICKGALRLQISVEPYLHLIGK